MLDRTETHYKNANLIHHDDEAKQQIERLQVNERKNGNELRKGNPAADKNHSVRFLPFMALEMVKTIQHHDALEHAVQSLVQCILG